MIYFDSLNPTWQDKFIERCKNVTSIYVKNKLIYGLDSINQKINNLGFDISPKSFFQVNLETASNLYKYALKRVNGQNITVDLYSGTGTIAMALAEKSRRVIAIESNKSAVANAKSNLDLNDIDNVEFKLGKVEDLIDELKEGRGTQFDPSLVDILLELIDSGRIDVSGINQLSVEAED